MSKPVLHFEIGCVDVAKAEAFYGPLFGWKTVPMGPAQAIQTGSSEGIQGHYTALGHAPHNYTIFYVQVEDIDAHLTQAVALGGRVVVPKVDIPNSGSFAWIGDPDGNIMGLWSPVAK